MHMKPTMARFWKLSPASNYLFGHSRSFHTASLLSVGVHSTPKHFTEAYASSEDADRVFSPSVSRNKDVIRDVVVPLIESTIDGLPKDAPHFILEVACGTGEHCSHFAASTPDVTWQPTDLTSDLFPSVVAHSKILNNVRHPFELDVSSEPWCLPDDIPSPMTIMCSNMCHISPWEVTTGLLKGSGKALNKSGILIIYGAFKVGGHHVSQSNDDFDLSLRARDPSWGVRDVDDLQDTAAQQGLQLVSRVPMPANNFILVFKKIGSIS